MFNSLPPEKEKRICQIWQGIMPGLNGGNKIIYLVGDD